MAAGCKNPGAVNFNGASTSENYSCIYLLKNQGDCHWFEDVPPDTDNDKSFTLSYSVKGQGWVFFHDYFPDMYIHTRENLFNSKDSVLYHNNKGASNGRYYGTTESFFIDVVFKTDADILLETVNWITEYLSSDTDQPFNTLSHISIWNSTQHTGRLALTEILSLTDIDEVRRTKGEWSFNDFRDILVDKGVPFLLNIFNDYALIGGVSDPLQPWYDKELLIDTWFCVRFEFDNDSNAKLILHDTNIQASKSIR